MCLQQSFLFLNTKVLKTKTPEYPGGQSWAAPQIVLTAYLEIG